MISIQHPTSFPSHPFSSAYSTSYTMADNGLLPANCMPPLLPTLSRTASQSNLSSSSESKSRSSQPGQKRRASRAGTRSVSTLTAAQLERKRANDREAQRAIRQRTKDHIESLERRIAELTATNDASAKLMQALQRNEELEQENSVLRSRLNHAVAAMSESGVPAEAIAMATGPTSPTRRLKLNTSLRSSTTSVPAPRSAPSSAVQPAMQPQETWNTPYSPVASTIERSPSLGVVSPAPTTMRWPPPHHHLGSPVAEPDRMMQPIVDPGVQHVSYNYLVDSNVRAVQYQAESPIVSYAQSTGTPPPMTDFQTRQSSAPMSATTGYTSYPSQPEYMAPSPHNETGMPMMQPQQQHLMYNMQQSMKGDHQPLKSA